jgi:hypothetical protein
LEASGLCNIARGSGHSGGWRTAALVIPAG